MNNRFFKVISVAALLAVIVIFSNQSYAKWPKKAKPAAAPVDQNTVIESNAPAAPSGHIKFDKTLHDFGEVPPDSVNNCSFKFTNTGPGKLIIAETRGTCKCTVPELAKKEYNPGESGEITVSFHAPIFAGPTSQFVHVSSNDVENPRAELTVKADVVSKVRVSPDIIQLSLVDANNAGAVPITIKSLDNEKFAVLSVESQGEVFSVAFDPNNRSDVHVLYPKVNIENLRRYLSGTLVFNIDHPSSRFLRVQYNCLKEFEASPNVIIVRDAEPNKPQERAIYLISNYNEPIEIESITSEKNFVNVVKQEQTANRYQINVSIMPPARQGPTRIFSDNLHIKIKNKQEIIISCRGFYKAGT